MTPSLVQAKFSQLATGHLHLAEDAVELRARVQYYTVAVASPAERYVGDSLHEVTTLVISVTQPDSGRSNQQNAAAVAHLAHQTGESYDEGSGGAA